MIAIPPPWVWFGGQRCEEVQLRAWLTAEVVTEARVEAIRAELTEHAIDSFELSAGLAPNTEVVALAQEYWQPFAEPLAREQWDSLVEPSVLWYSTQVSCVQAWNMSRGRRPELVEMLQPPFETFLMERRQVEPQFEQQLAQMLSEHGEEFAWQALEALPGPPPAEVKRAVRD